MARWVIDPDHSVASFVVRHMMIANVRGQFNRISGTIVFDPENIPASSVEVIIEAAGIYTGIQKRDDHLRSPDFLDVEKFPHISFKSSRAENPGGRRLRVAGDITIRGITRNLVLETECSGPEKSPYGETSMGFAASARINREDFGMIWNVALESGGVMVGKDILIALDVESDLIGA